MTELDKHIIGIYDPNAPFNVDDFEPIEWYSDCCGVTMTGVQLDYGICPDCGEHCVIIEVDKDGNERTYE